MPTLGRVLLAIRSLALVVWVGGLIFFASVVAPVAFHRLPSAHEAGLVVGGTLRVLHAMGLVAGLVYLLATAAGTKLGRWWVGPVLVGTMMGLTAISQWGLLPRMEVDRARAGGAIETAGIADPARADFERLHVLSERIEGGVLLLGLAAVCLLTGEREVHTPRWSGVRAGSSTGQ